MNDVVKIVSISDIHMGVLDPRYMYAQLKQQFVDRLINLDFDVLAICGDIFDAKYMSNNPIISYTLQLVDDIVNLCISKQATLILLAGTLSHDNNQLSLFYHYLGNPSIDIRIVETIKFELVKGMRVLCIPELYGIPEEEYKKVLFDSGYYDLVLMHGTLRGSFKGSEVATLNSNHAPVFSLRAFENCGGIVLAGHYHTPGCYEEYMYYNGSPLRFAFGQEETKGFLVTLYNKHTRRHYTELIPIDSYIYNTITIDHLMNEDPKKIIEYIKHEKETKGIDFIRIKYSNPGENMNVVLNYFRNTNTVKFKETGKKEKQQQQIDEAVMKQNEQYSYILDDNISGYDKFVKYVNQNEGYDFITVDELVSILEGDV